MTYESPEIDNSTFLTALLGFWLFQSVATGIVSMTSKLSDAEVGAQLREMGQDIGPMNGM